MKRSKHLAPDRGALVPHLGGRRQEGFSLLEASLVLTALMAVVLALGYKTADFFNKSQSLDSDALIALADNQLRQYVVANGRLPCPDSNADGYSDGDADGSCQGLQKGYLPYKTLGMLDTRYVYGEVPMLYGVYNNNGLNFADKSQTFTPFYQDTSNASQSVSTSRNTFDFCASLATLKALDQASAPPFASGALGVTDGISNSKRAVYALAVPGKANRDALPAAWSGRSFNAQYDGLNATSANWFEWPQAPVRTVYDDRTFFRSAEDLHDFYRCDAMNSSVSLLIEAVTMQQQTLDYANENVDNVKQGLITGAAGVAMAAWQLGQSLAAIAQAGEEIGVATGLLATNTALCPIPPWAACALIPVYATSLANATVGMALAAAATVTAAVGMDLNYTATVLYANLQSRTATAPSDPPNQTSNISDDRLQQLRTQYVGSDGASGTKAQAIAAYQKLPNPAPTQADIDGYKATRDDKLGSLNASLDNVKNSTLKDILKNNLNGNTKNCPDDNNPDCASIAANYSALGYTRRQVPDTDRSGNVKTDSNGNTVYTYIYSKDLLPGASQPGVAPALNVYYQVLAQSGVPTTSTQVYSGTGANSIDPAVTSAINQSNSTLSASATAKTDPAASLSTANTLIDAYSDLLYKTADFDTKNLAYQANQSSDNATARTAALTALQSAMGNPTWTYSGSTSLCGTGGCGWMAGATATTGTSSSLGTTRSASVNDYLSANSTYETAKAYQSLKDAADSAASAAWSDRNNLKSAVCAKQGTPWVGSGTPNNNDPGQWDRIENLTSTVDVLKATPLSCTGSPPPDNSSPATKAKYCTQGLSTYDADKCALYNLTGSQSVIRGASNITNAVIQKGISR